MATAKKCEWNARLKILVDLLKSFKREDLSSGSLEMMVDALGDIKIADMKKACTRAISNCVSCPTIAHILEAHRELHQEWLLSHEWLCVIQPKIYQWMEANTDYRAPGVIYQDQLDGAIEKLGLEQYNIRLDEMS